MPSRTLLVDLTPLDTPTRHRGNGRYLRELALGLAAIPTAELGGLRLLALTHLEADGRCSVTDDLAAFGGTPCLSAPGPRDHYRWAYARRFGLWRATRRLGVHGVHLGDPNAKPLMMRLSGCKTIVTCHDMIPLVYPERYLGWKDGGPMVGRLIERRRYRSATRVVAISEATRHDLERFVGLPHDRVSLVYNGIDVAGWAAPPARPATDVLARLGLGERPFVLAIGAADWHKNPEGAVAGLAAARRSGLDVELAWAGRLRPDHVATLDAAARAHGIYGRVRRLGFVDDGDLAVLLREALAHLLVSHCEGFGLTVVEAMAAGCAVITTRGGSLAEVAGDAALTVDPDDYEAIGAAIGSLAREPSVREQLVARGRARAPQFSREAQARAMIAVYRDVVGA